MNAKNSQDNRLKEGIVHVLFWLLIIHFIFDIGGLFSSVTNLFVLNKTVVFDEALLLIPISIGIFYLNLFILIPQFFKQKNWIWYCLSLLLSYVFACFFTVGVGQFLLHNNFVFYISKQELSDFSVEVYLQTLIASTALGIAKNTYRNLALKRQAEQKQKEAELKYLANQFNPHFLYNTLNGIYSKAIEENAPQTTEIIVVLSEILRYPINQGLKTNVSLEEEIKFIEDYIMLQKLRLGDDYPIRFEADGSFEKINILPLSLIVLVENSFKYGVSIKDRRPIFFRLRQDGNYIHFTAENYYKSNEKISSHNIGIENLKKRIQLNYDNNFSLKTRIEENKYFVDLKLKIKKPAENKA